jgi:hypothetical protein
MTEHTEINNAAVLANALKDLQAIRNLAAGDIESLTITAKTTQSQLYTMIVTPADTGWGAVLTSLNTVVTGKVAAVRAALIALGITSVPT